MISDADIAQFIADDATPRVAERPDWLDDVFDGFMLDPVNAVPGDAALWAVVAACVFYGALLCLVIWAVTR